MSNEPDFEHEIAGGKVYIKILMAERWTGKRWRGDDYVQAEEILGRVQLATSPEWSTDIGLGFVKVRGRRYGIENILRHETQEHWDRDDKPRPWRHESSYFGGYRNDRGGRVSFDAKAWDALEQIERDALAAFEKAHPDWEKDSARKRFEYERDRAFIKASEARAEAEKADRKGAEWQKRIDEMGGL
ncbi:hypothetical protein ABZY93_22260 [Streptomyces smyrnaeus]|uniref:hypothetical protein n=1 Tax=Streptomyces smyrnaeus TaxID=1387713 RepID=UPI00339FB404